MNKFKSELLTVSTQFRISGAVRKIFPYFDKMNELLRDLMHDYVLINKEDLKHKMKVNVRKRKNGTSVNCNLNFNIKAQFLNKELKENNIPMAFVINEMKEQMCYELEDVGKLKRRSKENV